MTMTEVRTVSSTGGEKNVKEARYDLLPMKPLWEVAELYGRGAEKYSSNNWRRGYEYSKSFSALQRHAWLWWGGEETDPETGKSHMASVVFHAFALMEFHENFPEFDDRFKRGEDEDGKEEDPWARKFKVGDRVRRIDGRTDTYPNAATVTKFGSGGLGLPEETTVWATWDGCESWGEFHSQEDHLELIPFEVVA